MTVLGKQDDIAIIGMSCLFAGAGGLSEYWRNIVGARQSIQEPPEGWGADRYYGTAGNGRISTAAGGFLGELYRFDPVDLGVMPSSIDGGEPDHLLALRITKEALADAGYLDDDYDHEKTGIILGHSTYLHRGNANVVQHGIVVDQTIDLLKHLFPSLDSEATARVKSILTSKLPPFNADMAPGLVPNVMTGRIANRLNFKGPNYLLDAACASSLLSVMAAMEELRAGRSDLMLAGGVNASLPAEVYMVFTQLGALSSSSKVRPFSSEADGTLLGEGLGVIVLKRLADARRDKDRIYAVIKAVGQSSDGKGLGLLAPNEDGEALAVRRAYQQADVDPATIGLIEAHGTGIPLGDRTEISALAQIFGARDESGPRTAIGSVKSLIGHCIPAAGVAGLIKTALALYHNVLPPTVCDRVSDELSMAETPFYVNTTPRPWIQAMNAPRRAGVNAFGFGGVNTHAILEQAPPDLGQSAQGGEWPKELVVIAANTREQLIEDLQGLLNRLDCGEFADTTLGEFAYGFAERNNSGAARLAIVADDMSDLARKIETARDRLRDGVTHIQARSGIFFSEEAIGGRLALVFPGEGCQYQGMLADFLMAFWEAREWFDFWETLFDDRRAIPPSRNVFPPPTTIDGSTADTLHNQLFDLELGSESVFIASQAILETLKRLELAPDVVAGHSSGENTALFAAGVLGASGWEDLRNRIRGLNQIYREIATSETLVDGALLTVGAVPRERILERVDEKQVYLALDNCQHQSVLFGRRDLLEIAASDFSSMGGLCAFLPIDRPYHTPLFAPVVAGIERLYESLEFHSPALPIYSCASASPLSSEPGEIRRLAATQWCSRVRFTETIERMYQDGVRTFVEVGPSSNLTGFIGDILKDKRHLAVALDNRRRSSLSEFLHGLGRLWVHGQDFRINALFENRNLTPANFETGKSESNRNMLFPNTLPYVSFSADEISEIRHAIGAPEAHRKSGSTGSEARVAPHNGELMTPAANGELANDVPNERSSYWGDTAMPQSHFDITQDCSTVRESIIQSALDPYAPETTPGRDGDFPFLSEIVECQDGRLTATCFLSANQDEFLRHHVLYASKISNMNPDLHSLAVVPLSVSLEMVTEAAACLASKPFVVRLENVRAHNWIALDDGSAELTLKAHRSRIVDGEEFLAASIYRDDACVFKADVVFADESHPGRPTLADLSHPKAPTWHDDALYATGMFHGPLFQSIRSLVQWDETGLDAVLNNTFLDGFFDEGRYPSLILNPVLLDAIGHVTAFWIAQDKGTNFSSFPSRIDRIDLPGANLEETEGAILRGRISIGNASNGRYLMGDYECVLPEGDVLFRASGWRDRFFDVPHRFYFARYRPLEGWYGEDISELFEATGNQTFIWFVPKFPPGFLDDAGGIWKRVLAHTVLSAEERGQWAAHSSNAKRRTDWLMGRIALKEVVRHWIERRHGISLYPADVIVRKNEAGKPYIALEESDGLQIPEVSLAHTDGNAIAVANAPGSAVGIDLELLGRIEDAASIHTAFTENELNLISGNDTTVDRYLYAWCAKEAAAKCLGQGLNGRPRAFELHEFSTENRNARVIGLGRELDIKFARLENALIALACPSSPTGEPPHRNNDRARV